MYSVLVDDNQFEYDVIVLRNSVRNLKITSNRTLTSQSLKVGYCNNISVQSPYRYKATDFVEITTLNGNLNSKVVDISSVPSDAKYIVIKPNDTYARSIKLECNY